jgi:hypothetical protein
MAAWLSALRTRRTLIPRNIIIFMVLKYSKTLVVGAKNSTFTYSDRVVNKMAVNTLVAIDRQWMFPSHEKICPTECFKEVIADSVKYEKDLLSSVGSETCYWHTLLHAITRNSYTRFLLKLRIFQLEINVRVWFSEIRHAKILNVLQCFGKHYNWCLQD